MVKPRGPRRDEVFEVRKASGGQIELVEIASQLRVSYGTVRGWKSKDKWDALNGTLQSRNGTFQAKEVQAEAVEQITAAGVVRDTINNTLRPNVQHRQ